MKTTRGCPFAHGPYRRLRAPRPSARARHKARRTVVLAACGRTNFIVATPAEASGCFKERSQPRWEKSGSGALGRAFLIFSTWRSFRAPPAISVPVRSAPPRYTLPFGSCEPLWALASWLCARPARTARSGGRGTLGRNLPGRRVSSTRHRRRRPSPAVERLRSVPGRKDGAIMRVV